MIKMIIEQLKAKEPDRDFVFIAIEELKMIWEIKQFYNEYCRWMEKNFKPEESLRGITCKQCADQNIGYILGYYDSDTRKLWNSVLNTINHPIFGRRY